MSESKSWAEKIMTSVNYLQNCYDQASNERDEWMDKYYKLNQEYENYKTNIERKQAEKCQACRQGTK